MNILGLAGCCSCVYVHRLPVREEEAKRAKKQLAARDYLHTAICIAVGKQVENMESLGFETVARYGDGGRVHLMGKGMKPHLDKLAAKKRKLAKPAR